MTPWQKAGMSYTSWWRHGKPDKAPEGWRSGPGNGLRTPALAAKDKHLLQADISEELWLRLKTRALNERRPANALVREALDAYLAA